MSNLIVSPKDYKLEEHEAVGISQNFNPSMQELKSYRDQYQSIVEQEISKPMQKEAKELREKLRQTRLNVTKIHKSEKAYYWQAGKFVDALKNKIVEPVSQMESKLKEIEDYEKIMEQKRIDELQKNRIEMVRPYVDSVEKLDLSNLDVEVFEAYLSTVKKKHEDKIEAERQEKIKAQQDREERERERKEAEELRRKLKKEQEENERLKAESLKRAESKHAEPHQNDVKFEGLERFVKKIGVSATDTETHLYNALKALYDSVKDLEGFKNSELDDFCLEAISKYEMNQRK